MFQMVYILTISVYLNNNSRQRNDIHLPQVTLAMSQKGVYYSGIKIFNDLSKAVKDISSKLIKFKTAV